MAVFVLHLQEINEDFMNDESNVRINHGFSNHSQINYRQLASEQQVCEMNEELKDVKMLLIIGLSEVQNLYKKCSLCSKRL
jgi:hypothetical protein